jgi:ribosomal protein S18 acetylase RimI-like enzyme
MSTRWDLRSNIPAGSDKPGRCRAGGTSHTLTRVRSGPELRELSAEQFTAELDVLTRIYALAMNAPAAELPGRMAIMERHAAHPAFRAVVASIPTGPGPGPDQDTEAAGDQRAAIGFAYGFHGSAGQWWHDVVRQNLAVHQGTDVAGRWLGDSFEFAEVHVRPVYQGRGTGRAMMHRLAAGRPERTAVLSTPDGQTRARRLYSSLGFADLLPAFTFPGAGPPYAIMGAVLPLRDGPPRADRCASPSRW